MHMFRMGLPVPTQPEKPAFSTNNIQTEAWVVIWILIKKIAFNVTRLPVLLSRCMPCAYTKKTLISLKAKNIFSYSMRSPLKKMFCCLDQNQYLYFKDC